MPNLRIIAALAKNRLIGNNGTIPWYLPEDLKRFKSLTLGHPVIMGRKTWDSLPARFRPLPGRPNVVITRDETWQQKVAIKAASFENAVAQAGEIDEEVFVIGGAQIYELALLQAHTLHLTLVDRAYPGDAFFPAYEHLFQVVISETSSAHDGLTYRFVDLQR